MKRTTKKLGKKGLSVTMLRSDDDLAESIVIAHASRGGGLARRRETWASRGLRVLNLIPAPT